MNRKVVIGILAAGAMLPAIAAWKGFTSENYVCGPKLTAEGMNGKVVLVDMWATWCGPCRAMMPHTEAIAKKYKSRGLVVVGSHVKSGFSKEKVESYVKGNGFTISFYKEAGWDGDIGKVDGIPYLYVVDKLGKVTYHGRNTAAIEKAIEAALKQASGSIVDESELVEYKSLKGKLTAGKSVEMAEKRLKTDIATAEKNPSSATFAKKKPEAEKILGAIDAYKKGLVASIEAEIAEGKATEAVKHIDLLTATWPSLKKDWAARRKELQAK